MDDWTQIVLAVLAVIGPLSGYFLAVRKASGRIKSTEAADLWEEAGDLRREYAERIKTLESEVKQGRERERSLQDEVWQLRRERLGGSDAR